MESIDKSQFITIGKFKISKYIMMSEQAPGPALYNALFNSNSILRVPNPEMERLFTTVNSEAFIFTPLKI